MIWYDMSLFLLHLFFYIALISSFYRFIKRKQFFYDDLEMEKCRPCFHNLFHIWWWLWTQKKCNNTAENRALFFLVKWWPNGKRCRLQISPLEVQFFFLLIWYTKVMVAPSSHFPFHTHEKLVMIIMKLVKSWVCGLHCCFPFIVIADVTDGFFVKRSISVGFILNIFCIQYRSFFRRGRIILLTF